MLPASTRFVVIDAPIARTKGHTLCSLVHVAALPPSTRVGELFTVEIVTSDARPLTLCTQHMLSPHTDAATKKVTTGAVPLYVHWESLTDTPKIGKTPPATWIRYQRNLGHWNLWKERIFRGRANAVVAGILLMRCAKEKRLFIATDNAELVHAIMREIAIDMGENPQEILEYLVDRKRVRTGISNVDSRIKEYVRDMQMFPPQLICKT